MKLFSFHYFLKKVFCMVLPIVLIFSSCVGASSPSSDTVKQSERWAEETAKDIVSKIRKDHPRIYLTPERIPGLKKEALSSKAHIFKLMKQRLGGPQAALFYALGDDKILGFSKSHQEYGRIAAEFLMKAIKEKKSSTIPDNLAIVYDWAYEALTATERKAYVDYCRDQLGNKVRFHNDRQRGYRSSPRPRGLIATLSFYGDGIDDEYAETLLIQGIRDTLLDNLAMEHVAGTKGGFADGTGYMGQLGGTFYPFLAISTATNSDIFFKHEVLTKLPNHLLYAMLPFQISRMGKDKSERYYATFHDNWTSNIREVGWRLLDYYAITAAEYRRHGDENKASLYMWFINEVYGGIPYQGSDPVAFVLMDWNIQPKSPKELGFPLAEALGWNEERGEIDRDRFGKKAGIGWVSMRSDWDNPDATFAIFKAEPFFYHGHMHPDSLAFMIAKGEELALARAGNYMDWYEGGPITSREQGWPQMLNFFSRTISSNNLLIYSPEEKYNEWTNDGGQRYTPVWDKQWGRTYNGTANENYRDIGGLIRFERNHNYVYSAADATRAYNSTLVTSGENKAKVKLVQREFVYIKSDRGGDDYFVIFDRVESVKPEFKKFWLLQLRAKPEFDGSHKIVVGREDGGIHLSEDTSYFYVGQEQAELHGKILLPKDGNRLVRRLGGWVTTHLRQSLRADDNGPLDIEVESTEDMPEHPVVIITSKQPDPNREVFDRFSVWPQAIHASSKPVGERVCYFCSGKTPPGKKQAKLLNCIRATKSSPSFAMPVGARVIQEFRHMGIEGADKGRDSERIDYPWGYGLGYNYGDGNQYGLWRIEVSPKKPSKYDNFLHVLHPALKGKGKLDAELIESEAGDIYGAKVGNKVVLFSRNPEPITKGSYKIMGSSTIWQLLCNLKPEKKYQIRQDGKTLLEKVASKQGTIQFDASLNKKSSQFEFKELN